MALSAQFSTQYDNSLELIISYVDIQVYDWTLETGNELLIRYEMLTFRSYVLATFLMFHSIIILIHEFQQ